MKIPKLLVIEHEENIRATLDEILTTIPCKYEMATCLAEARQSLAQNSHSLILMGDELPARLGGTPRMQNPENFLEELNERGNLPPVVMMTKRRPDVDEEDKLRWAGDMRTRGVKTFLCKPFRTAGRTPDRVIKKMLAGQVEPARLEPSTPPTEKGPQVQAGIAENVVVRTAAPPTAKKSGPAREPPAGQPAPVSAGGKWPSVPNEPVGMDDFIAKFCEQRSKESRMHRKRALLGAARHGTVKLPPQADKRKHGQSNKYFTHDLLAAWQGFLDEGVDLPPLQPQYGGANTA